MEFLIKADYTYVEPVERRSILNGPYRHEKEGKTQERDLQRVFVVQEPENKKLGELW